ncbi:M1 family metallopeptidase [Paenibacillus sp. GCM10023252]|uniref:M1 family metallopeptidase n=1 Tax=Paenibacillus sp. GCM10023252 TaxID=3252649 RepID=UPI00360DA848
MTPRHVTRLALFLLTAILLVFSLQGFGDAWLSQYTYAYAPATKAKPSPPSNTAKPPAAAQEPDSVMQPKPVALSKRVTEYHIQASLNEEAKTITAEQSVTWTNPGRKTVSELYFHLYPNAFLSDKSTFMRESGGQLRQDKATSDSLGYMKLLTLKTTEGETLLPRLHYEQPDDGNHDDYTLAKLHLPVPVEPNKSVTLRMSYEVKLPEVFARMGYSGDFIMAGQWFPKLAVYETAGTRGRSSEGWNAHQYHGNSEFYSDFGIYSVRIKVPAKYKVAATGFQTKPIETKDGLKIYQFYADDVHDFAWAASPDFVYDEAAYSTKGVPGVRIKLYLDPAHAHLKDRYMHAAKTSLAKYAQWYGEYPYSTLSVVVPPKGGNGAGGMEYPTLVTAFAAEHDNPGYDLERTVVHEIGHQYWYGMVASNEFEEAWLDEGFTSYAEDKVMESEYGVEPNLRVESSYMTDPAPLKQLSWSYDDNNHYAENVYIRAKLVLVGMEKQVGTKTMQKIMRTYFSKYKFRHPSTSDFQKVVEGVTKTKWTNYFNQYVYGNEMADFAVDTIQVKPAEKDGKRVYESTVVVSKRGGSYGPIPIEFRFADGNALTQQWDGSQAHMQFKLIQNTPLLWAALDPQHTNVLDNKQINNFMKAEIEGKQRTRWSVGAAKMLEIIVGAIGW